MGTQHQCTDMMMMTYKNHLFSRVFIESEQASHSVSHRLRSFRFLQLLCQVADVQILMSLWGVYWPISKTAPSRRQWTTFRHSA